VAKAKSSKKGKIVEIYLDPIEGARKIGQEHLQKLLRYEAEVRASKAELTLKQMQASELFKKVDPEGLILKAQIDLELTKATYSKYKDQYQSIMQEIGQIYSVDLTKVSYDDETGIIHENL
jgi:hypothetical protein